MKILSIRSGALCALLALGALAPARAADPKIAFVNVDEVATGSKSIQSAIKGAEESLKGKQEEMDKLTQDFKRAQNDLKARRSALSDAEVRKQEAAIQEMRDQLDALDLEVNKQLRRTEIEVMGPAVDRILAKIKEVGKARGFDLVLRSDVVIYGVDALNITSLVVQELDKDAKGR